MRKIGLWTDINGNMRSAMAGLDKEQLEFLQSLQLGDRLVIWKNDHEEKNRPQFTLDKAKERPSAD